MCSVHWCAKLGDNKFAARQDKGLWRLGVQWVEGLEGFHAVVTACGAPKWCVDQIGDFKKQLTAPLLEPLNLTDGAFITKLLCAADLVDSDQDKPQIDPNDDNLEDFFATLDSGGRSETLCTGSARPSGGAATTQLRHPPSDSSATRDLSHEAAGASISPNARLSLTEDEDLAFFMGMSARSSRDVSIEDQELMIDLLSADEAMDEAVSTGDIATVSAVSKPQNVPIRVTIAEPEKSQSRTLSASEADDLGFFFAMSLNDAS